MLERLAAAGRRALHIVVDNGPEFVSKVVDQWTARSGVNLRFIAPGKPMQSAFVESFNGKFRDTSARASTGSSAPKRREG